MTSKKRERIKANLKSKRNEPTVEQRKTRHNKGQWKHIYGVDRAYTARVQRILGKT